MGLGGEGVACEGEAEGAGGLGVGAELGVELVASVLLEVLRRREYINSWIK